MIMTKSVDDSSKIEGQQFLGFGLAMPIVINMGGEVLILNPSDISTGERRPAMKFTDGSQVGVRLTV